MKRSGLGAVALFACASWGGVPDAELPAQPIAISYRTPEEARARADALRRAEPESPAVGAEGPTWVGSKAYLRADASAVERMLANAFGREDRSEMHLGRLALLDARSGEVTFVEGALRGAVPQAWTRDRSALLFAQPTTPGGDDVQIFEWNVAAHTVRRVTVGPPIHSQACYGPDARIAVAAVEVASNGAATSRIAISGPGGRAPWTDLSAGPADHTPTCSPDGSAVAFARLYGSGRSEIWLAPAPFGAPARRLAPGRDPRFAQHGSWIVYAVPSGRSSRLFRIRADGSGRAPIGPGGRDEVWPSASPDGKLVAYVASEESSRRVLVRRFDGSGDRLLLATGDGEHPVW
jgi:Tol biopolymer transport system component